MTEKPISMRGNGAVAARVAEGRGIVAESPVNDLRHIENVNDAVAIRVVAAHVRTRRIGDRHAPSKRLADHRDHVENIQNTITDRIAMA